MTMECKGNVNWLTHVLRRSLPSMATEEIKLRFASMHKSRNVKIIYKNV